MIKLDQYESNLYWFIKDWYKEDDFWKSLGILCENYYGYKQNEEAMYYFVRHIWIKLMEEWPNKDSFLLAYDMATLPSNNWGTRGMSGSMFSNIQYGDKELMEARTAAMCSQIRCTEAKYFDPMPIQQIGELVPKTVAE